jgi:hypothetical protein
MRDLERYLLWGAIVILFIIVLWPRASMYSGEPKSITQLAEFTDLNDGIKRLYNDQILRGLKAWAPTFNKWWTDIPADAKAQLTGMFKQAADQQVANAATAKTINGLDVLKKSMRRQTSSPPPNPPPSPSPPPTVNRVSKYMTQPFMPMVSGFSLQDAIDKANNATKI